MEAAEFLVIIKANGNSKDWDDLAKVYNEYKSVLAKLSTKDRGSFSLNVLCLLCRNLDKVPSWKDAVDSKNLLTLSIDCIRETRGLNKAELVKTLACIYHIHKHVVKKNASVPPELILKISFMAFEADTENLLKEYCKTYWNILADRLTYIEKLKGKSLHKLLPKITEDILKTIAIYDTVQFCGNVLVFLIKKLHGIYSESNSAQLNVLYGEIFKKLASNTDLNGFKKNSDGEILDLYTKISDCLYVVAENASKTHFKGSMLSISVRAAISLLGHHPDMFHCLQTFYLNSFCDLFENKTSYIDTVFKNLSVSCDITEKLGYKKTMVATYAYLNQFLRLFIEYSVTNTVKENFTLEVQESCLNFMLKVISMLKYSQQLLKCDNCNVKTGLHDALRLSFLLKHFITNSLEYKIDTTTLTELYNKLITAQYNIMDELKHLKCANHKKFYQKLQIDTHNTAILLEKHQKYEFSNTLFELYIKSELINCKSDLINQNKNEIELKNISRAFYNKSICEMDCKKYEMALLDAFLSLIFSEELNSEKYMTLVMEIKAKSLKNDKDDDENDKNDDLQMISVLEACKMIVEKGLYGNVMTNFKNVKFSALLKHEFTMYIKLWPSTMPIAGVWRSLQQFLEGDWEKWMTVEDEEMILWTMLEVISLTVSAVRTIDNEHFKDIVIKVLNRIEKIPDPIPIDIRVVQTTLLFLKTEYDIASASLKHGWKITDTNIDPDQIQITRTVQQEHEALQSALQAVEIWTEIITDINSAYRSPLLDIGLSNEGGNAHNRHAGQAGWRSQGVALASVTLLPVTDLLLNYAFNWDGYTAHSRSPVASFVVQHTTPTPRAVTKSACLNNAVVLAEIFVQQLLYFNRYAHGLQLAHICCQVSQYTGQKAIYIRNAGILAYHIPSPSIQGTITLAAEYWAEMILSEASVETALEFLSNVAIYYFKSGAIGMAAKLVQLAQTRILKTYEKNPDINLDLAVGRLMEAQTMITKDSGLTILSEANGLQRHYISLYASILPNTTWSGRRFRAVSAKLRAGSCSTACARACAHVRLLRRARAAAASAVQAYSATEHARAHRYTVNTHNIQLAQVIIDNRLKYIIGIATELPTSVNEPKVELFAPKQDLEVMLESQPFKSISPTRKYVQIPGFKIPDFIKHTQCDCYACDNIYCTIISYIIGGLEASMYFRANEIEIAKNYYKGVIHSFGFFENKLKNLLNKYTEMDFEKYIIDHVKNVYEDEFKTAKLEILIEAAYFELKNKNFDMADDYLVTVHEILQEFQNPDDYLSNEVHNLMIASAKVRNVVKKQENSLEIEFENLKLSPKGDIPKTPISKPKIPELSAKKVIVKDEELPKKRKVIKLNLDEGSSDEKEKEKPKTRKPVFKIPVPVTSKPVLENITPRVTRKPEIVITEVTNTPKTGTKEKNPEFFTPQSTPEQFFTPLNTIKTYSKSNLRKGIVKNLEEEFSTPLGKEIREKSLEVPTRSGRRAALGSLRRATSPGKLGETASRPRRIRQPKLNDD